MKKRKKLPWIIPDSERYGAIDIIGEVFEITIGVGYIVFWGALGAFVLNLILFFVVGLPLFVLPLVVLILAILIVIIGSLWCCVPQVIEAREKNQKAWEARWAQEAAERRRKAEQEEQDQKKQVDKTCRAELDLALQNLAIHLDSIDRIMTPKEKVSYLVSHDTTAVDRSLADMETCKSMITSIIEKEIL